MPTTLARSIRAPPARASSSLTLRRIVATAQKEHEQIYPKPGWVEHDPNEIWRRTQTIAEAMAMRGLRLDLAAIGITNQRETTVVWNRRTGGRVQRDRLAGHARRRVRRSCRAGGRRPLPRPHGPADFDLLQRPQDPLDSR